MAVRTPNDEQLTTNNYAEHLLPNCRIARTTSALLTRPSPFTSYRSSYARRMICSEMSRTSRIETRPSPFTSAHRCLGFRVAVATTVAVRAGAVADRGTAVTVRAGAVAVRATTVAVGVPQGGLTDGGETTHSGVGVAHGGLIGPLPGDGSHGYGVGVGVGPHGGLGFGGEGGHSPSEFGRHRMRIPASNSPDRTIRFGPDEKSSE